MKNTVITSHSKLRSDFEALDESLVIPFNTEEDKEANDEFDRKRFYGFKIAKTHLLIDTSVRSEMVNDVVITSIPLMPSHVKGLFNLRGNLVPVYDMCKRFSLQDDDSNPSNKVLVLGDGDEMAGILIHDSVIPLQFVERDIRFDVESEDQALSEFITYCYSELNNKWFGFDHVKLFKAC